MRSSIRKKTLLITSLGILIVSAFFISLHIRTMQKEADTRLNEFFTYFDNHVFLHLKKEAENIILITEHSVIKNMDIMHDFVQSQRDDLHKKTLPLYNDLLKKYNGNLSIMHYYKPGVKSFLRMHEPEKYGDVTKEHRPMLSLIDESSPRKIMSGFESGRFSFAYRVNIPLFLESKYIGIMDYGLEAAELMHAVSRKSDVHLAIFITDETSKPIKYHEFEEINKDLILYSSTHPLFSKLQNIPSDFQTEYIKHNEKTFALYSVPLKDFNDNIIAHYIIAKDVTALQNEISWNIYVWSLLALALIILNIIFLNKSFIPMIKRLTEQKKLLAKAQSMAHLGYFELDLQTWEIEYSREFYKISQIEPGTKIDYNGLKEMFFAEDTFKFDENIQNAIKTGDFIESKCRLFSSDKIIHLQGDVLYDKKNLPAKIICVVLDISENERLVSELKELNKNLENRVAAEVEKQRKQELLLLEQSRLASMGELVQSISHHWRQPLAAVSLIVQDIEEAFEYGELDKKYLSSSVAQAHSILERMSKTIDHFRDFVKKDEEKEYFDAIKALNETVSLQKEALSDDGIHLVYENNLNYAEKAFAIGYPSEFKQAISNIIQNARDAIVYAPNPTPKTIRVMLERFNKKLVITISDSAGGIREDIMGKIFDPYFTTREQGKGTGIGLYMVKTLLEKHMHGTVSAQNTEKGALFTISLDSE